MWKHHLLQIQPLLIYIKLNKNVVHTCTEFFYRYLVRIRFCFAFIPLGVNNRRETMSYFIRIILKNSCIFFWGRCNKKRKILLLQKKREKLEEIYAPNSLPRL